MISKPLMNRDYLHLPKHLLVKPWMLVTHVIVYSHLLLVGLAGLQLCSTSIKLTRQNNRSELIHLYMEVKGKIDYHLLLI